MIPSDVWAMACIAGCGAASVGATAAVLDAPLRGSHDTECVVVVDDHRVGITFSSGDGDLFVVSPGNVAEFVVQAEGDAEKCRRKRHRHRHPHAADRARAIERAMERAERSRERAERMRERARERAMEAQERAMEAQERAMERAERARERALDRGFRLEIDAMEEALEQLEHTIEVEVEGTLERELQSLEVELDRALRGGNST